MKFIQLSKVAESKLLAVIMVDGNIVKNKLIDTTYDLKNDEILKFNILLNTFLQGAALEDINLELIQTMKMQAGEYADILETIFQGIMEAIHEADDLKVYTSGATNIFRYPELAEGEKASKLIGTLEQKEVLQEFVSVVNADQQGDGGIQVYIGDETPIQSMKDCSVVTANYDLGGGLRGTVGIIGPKRMDYEKVLGTLKNLMNQLDAAFKKDER